MRVAHRSSEEEGPFPTASSPELLEDFRRAQQVPAATDRGAQTRGLLVARFLNLESLQAGEADSLQCHNGTPNMPPLAGERWEVSVEFRNFLN